MDPTGIDSTRKCRVEVQSISTPRPGMFINYVYIFIIYYHLNDWLYTTSFCIVILIFTNFIEITQLHISSIGFFVITLWGRVTHIGVIKLSHDWFRLWLVAWQAPSHYLNQWWNKLNWTLGNIFQWNRNQNTTIFIQENAFENVVWKMTAIMSRPQCDNRINWLVNWTVGGD